MGAPGRLSAFRRAAGGTRVPSPHGRASQRTPAPSPRRRSLSVHAEPFRAGARAAPLALAALPAGLTLLSLRHVDVADDAEGARGRLFHALCLTPKRDWLCGRHARGLAAPAPRPLRSRRRVLLAPPPPPPAALAAAPPLPRLASLSLESVRLRAPQLGALARGAPRLANLSLARVAGLSDAALGGLTALGALEELAVAAPHNRAVSQRGLLALAPLRSLRRGRPRGAARRGAPLAARATVAAVCWRTPPQPTHPPPARPRPARAGR